MKTRSGIEVMFRLAGLVKSLAGYMVIAVLMGIIGFLCATFITIFGGYAILHSLHFDVPFSLKTIFISVCIFALLRGILRYAEQACNHYIAFRLLAFIRDKVFRALRRLAPAKLEGREKGDLIAIITSDIELLEVFYAHTISPILIAIGYTIILCGFIGSFHWSMGVLALVAYIGIGIFVPLLISHISGDDGIRFRTKSGELSSFVLDSLRGLSEIIQYGEGENRLEQMNQKTDAISKEEERMKYNTGKNIAITNTMILFFDLSMLFLAVFLYQDGVVNFDGVLIPVMALMSSFGPCVALANLGSTLQNTFAAGNRVLDILDEVPVVEDITGQEEIGFEGASIQNIHFSYGKDIILSDLSVEIPKHTIVGITGKSGSGKSTLLKLLMRFWEVQKGEVSLSGKKIHQINTDNLRTIESFVTQDTHLFQDSIKNNLRIAKLDATEEEIKEACRKASIDEFIESLPEGYDTKIGELGDTLSGGERQRLGLARAFLHDADLMLLDEPTSNLDSLNEAVILRSLREESGEKTVVLVSHRESTMRIADKVYSVEEGSRCIEY